MLPTAAAETVSAAVSMTTTGTIGDRPSASTAAGSQRTDRVAGQRELVTLRRHQLEALAIELDGVDAEVHEHTLARGGEHHERVRVQLEEGVRPPARPPCPGCVQDRSRRRNRRSAGRTRGRARRPAPRPCPAPVRRHPGVVTPCPRCRSQGCRPRVRRRPAPRPATHHTEAPAALSAVSSTSAGSSTSARRRVMHGSTSTMLASPPSPSTICSALSGCSCRHLGESQPYECAGMRCSMVRSLRSLMAPPGWGRRFG